MVSTANIKFRDAQVAYQIELMRLSGSINSRIIQLLNATEAELKDEIMRVAQGMTEKLDITAPATLRKLNALKDSITELRQAAMNDVLDEWTNQMRQLAVATPSITAAQLAATMPVIFDTILPAPGLLRALVTEQPFMGLTLKQWAQDIADRDIHRIMNEIRIGMVQGQSIPDIAARVVGHVSYKGKDGTTQITRNQAIALTRTAVIHFSTAARSAFFKENADFISEEVWVSTLDSRTTVGCMALDGKRFPVGEGIQPGYHFNSLAAGTSIRTDKGDIPIEEVRADMKVLTHRGRFMPVSATMRKICDNGEIFRIVTASGRVLLATDEHPVLTRDGWSRADALKIGDEVFHNGEQPIEAMRVASPVVHPKNYPSLFDQPSISYEILTESIPVVGMFGSVDLQDHFRRDKGKVSDAVRDDMLMYENKSGFLKYFKKLQFTGGRVFAKAFNMALHGFSFCNRIVHRVVSLHSPAVSFSDFTRIFLPTPSPMQMTGASRNVDFISSYTICPGPDFDPVIFAIVRDLPRWGMQVSRYCAKRALLFPMFFLENIAQIFFADRRRNPAHLVKWMVSTFKKFTMLATGLISFPEGAKSDSKFFTTVRHLVHREAETFSDTLQAAVFPPVFSLDHFTKTALADHWHLARIIKIEKVPYSEMVYNISVVGDESYVAEGIIVHNCRSARVGIVTDKLIGQRPFNPITLNQLLNEFTDEEGLESVSSRDDLPHGTKGQFDEFARKRVRQLIGTTPASTTYAEFLKGQSAAFQDEVLGKTKGLLFRKGGLTLDRFVDRAGNELTLQQLVRKYSDAFIEAGLDPSKFF